MMDMDLSKWLSGKAEEALVSLLGTKHLYQSLQVDRDAIVAEAKVQGLLKEPLTEDAIDQALASEWHAHDESSAQLAARHAVPDDFDHPPSIAFLLTSIKTSCALCKAVTPMNMVLSCDLYRSYRIKAPSGNQDFLFLFQCQSCRSTPDAFLVRRRGLKLTLCGRAPMEIVIVPPSIPNNVRRYYSDGVIAYQSGQVLPALFLLRVLIEQYIRASVPETADMKADQGLEVYMKKLPGDFRRRFPSLKEIYGRLSAALHSADESNELFQESLEKIKTHFDAIRLFEKASGKEIFEIEVILEETAEHSIRADG